MDVALGLALYFMIWWLTLFTVLPFGVRTQEEAGAVEPGTPASAPARFNWRKVFFINTLVACVAFAIVWAAIENNWLGSSAPVQPPPPVLAQ